MAPVSKGIAALLIVLAIGAAGALSVGQWLAFWVAIAGMIATGALATPRR